MILPAPVGREFLEGVCAARVEVLPVAHERPQVRSYVRCDGSAGSLENLLTM
jgi:hypothetical protein